MGILITIKLMKLNFIVAKTILNSVGKSFLSASSSCIIHPPLAFSVSFLCLMFQLIKQVIKTKRAKLMAKFRISYFKRCVIVKGSSGNKMTSTLQIKNYFQQKCNWVELSMSTLLVGRHRCNCPDKNWVRARYLWCREWHWMSGIKTIPSIIISTQKEKTFFSFFLFSSLVLFPLWCYVKLYDSIKLG